MSQLPLYQNDPPLPTELEENGHAGLWFDRFFNGYDAQWDATQARLKFLEALARTRCGDRDALSRHLYHRGELVDRLAGLSRHFASEWHWITGMGLPHPVENGFSWHPTLAAPYLPGSSVKGLVRAYLEQTESSGASLLHLFGSDTKETGKQGCEHQAGALIFFDAIPIEPVQLALDVMTPHAGQWYAEGNTRGEVPADWHSPVPINFLAAHRATLQFAIAPRPGGIANSDDVEFALSALANALDLMGFGAKTAVGYGFMQPDGQADEALADRQQDRYTAAQRARLSEEQRTLHDIEALFSDPIQLRSGSALSNRINRLMDDASDWPEEDRGRAAELSERFYQQTSWGNSKKKKDRRAKIAVLRQQ